MAISHVIWLDACEPAVAPKVGGKALGLGALRRAGLQVPPGFAVTTDAYREAVIDTGFHRDIAICLADVESIDAQQAASEQIRHMFESFELPARTAGDVRDAYERMGGDAVSVAVRSSATAEDTAEASFAGQQETYLWISGADAVNRHVVECWGSLFTPQAIAYRARLAIPTEDVAMGVVVQQMVAAAAAGVMITLDPVTGDRSQIAIESSYGLGLAVVGGEVTPDRYSVDKVTWEIGTRVIGPKTIAYGFDPTTGEVVAQDVADDARAMSSLTDDEVIRLARLGRAVEKANGGPQDVEWAIGPGPDGPRELFLLQMRPETVWSQKEAAAPTSDPSEDIVSRMVRAMSNPTTPGPGSPAGGIRREPTGDNLR